MLSVRLVPLTSILFLTLEILSQDDRSKMSNEYSTPSQICSKRLLQEKSREITLISDQDFLQLV